MGSNCLIGFFLIMIALVMVYGIIYFARSRKRDMGRIEEMHAGGTKVLKEITEHVASTDGKVLKLTIRVEALEAKQDEADH